MTVPTIFLFPVKKCNIKRGEKILQMKEIEKNPPQKKNDKLSDNLLLLHEIISIVYQVTDFTLAAEMILDTCTEFFAFDAAAIALYDETDSYYKISAHQQFNEAFKKQFQFNRMQKINEVSLSHETLTEIPVYDGTFSIGDKTFPLPGDCTKLLMAPLRFYEKTNAYLIIGLNVNRSLSHDEKQLLKIFSIQVAPLVSLAKPRKKEVHTYDTIISKVIKDRVNESRLALNPISFAIYRISLKNHYEDVFLLDNDIQAYQKIVNQRLNGVGDLIWLAADSALFIYPRADIFSIESLSVELKEQLEKSKDATGNKTNITLHYSCMSFPQSGDNAEAIINNLWLKLFNEMSAS